MKRYFYILSLCILLVSNTKIILAHREDYTDETLVYQTVEKGEIEPEYWLDVGRREDNDPLPSKIDFVRHNLALEYGMTEQWMIDGRFTIEDEEHENIQFDSGRVETRYRFFEEGQQPVDMAISGEINVERDEENDWVPGIEPRLILSKDFQELNVTLNLPLEIIVDPIDTEFVPSVGIRYNATDFVRIGVESRYHVDSHVGSVFPQVWFAFPHDITIKLGYSFGFDHNNEDFARIVWEVGF